MIDTTDAGLAVVIFGFVRQLRRRYPKIDGIWVLVVVLVMSAAICVALNPHALVEAGIKAIKVAAIALGTSELAGYNAQKTADETSKIADKTE